MGRRNLTRLNTSSDKGQLQLHLLQVLRFLERMTKGDRRGKTSVEYQA